MWLCVVVAAGGVVLCVRCRTCCVCGVVFFFVSFHFSRHQVNRDGYKSALRTFKLSLAGIPKPHTNRTHATEILNYRLLRWIGYFCFERNLWV